VLARDSGDTAWECQSKAATCVMLFSSTGDPANGLTTYQPMMGAQDGSSETTEADWQQMATVAYDVHSLRATVDTAVVSGAGDKWTITLRVDGIDDTTLQCEIVHGGSTTCTDSVGTASIAAGELMSWSIAPTSTPTDGAAIYISACGEPQ